MKEQPLKNTHPITFRPFDLKQDAALVLEWINAPRAKYWGMLGSTLDDFITVYQALLAVPNYQIYVGEVRGVPTFLMEAYDPISDSIGEHYTVLEGDIGMHVLVAPPQQPIHGLTWHIFSSIMEFLFEQANCQRVIVEPDVQNEKIHRLNKRAGFEYQAEVILPHKTAYLAFCTPRQYKQATQQLSSSN